MNKIEDYFKDKIDWKVFNAIKDACTELEDMNESVSIEVCVVNNKFDCLLIYTNFDPHDLNSTKYIEHADYELDKYKKRYEKFGLFYRLGIYNNEGDFEHIINKLLKNKNMKLAHKFFQSSCNRYYFKSSE